MGWKSELQAIIRAHGDRHARKNKIVSNETRQQRAEVLFSIFRELHEIGYKLENPRNLGGRHVEALVQRWRERLGAAAIQRKLSILRTFAKWIGKPGLVPPTTKLAPEARRTYIAKRDKSWSAACQNWRDIIAKVKADDVWVGTQLEMMWAFGLRRKEAICLRPVVADRGEYLESHPGAPLIYIEQGTKGGRPRNVDLAFMPDAADRRAALDAAKALVLQYKGPDGHLGEPGRSLKQAIKRFEYVMRKHGITKSQLGFTSHGLRHQAMCDAYEALVGESPPVRGGQAVANDAEQRLRLSETAGHSRLQITRAYYG
jgi:integrase